MKRTLKALAAATTLMAIAGVVAPANAALVITSAVGGAPTGVNYVNFDGLPLGSSGGTSGLVGVSFGPDGQTVMGTSSTYAAPYLSSSNGTLFGDSTVSGPDTTHYLTTGVGTVTLTLPGNESYLGLLWGSVDPYNTLQFYNGAALVGTATGSDIFAGANGNQGANGTFYVNIASTLSFDSVVASSSQYAFEFDNVAYNPTNPVPEPLSLGLVGMGILAMSGFAKRARN